MVLHEDMFNAITVCCFFCTIYQIHFETAQKEIIQNTFIHPLCFSNRKKNKPNRGQTMALSDILFVLKNAKPVKMKQVQSK